MGALPRIIHELRAPTDLSFPRKHALDHEQGQDPAPIATALLRPDGLTGTPDDIGWQLLDNQEVNTTENYAKGWTPLFSVFGLGAGAGNFVPDPNAVGPGGTVNGDGGGNGGIYLVVPSELRRAPSATLLGLVALLLLVWTLAPQKKERVSEQRDAFMEVQATSESSA